MSIARFDVELPLPPSLNGVSDQTLKDLYAQHRSVWAVGRLIGWTGQRVHKRLRKLGAVTPMNVFSDADRETLRKSYQLHANAGTLADLAQKLGRTKQFICRQAGLLGLTSKSRQRVYSSTWKYIEEPEATKIWAKFKASGLGLKRYCDTKGYDDLGFSQAMKRFFADEWEHVIEAKAPRSGKYRLGRAFEYRVRDKMKEAGFFVMRSPASRSPIDLLAVRAGTVLMVQCKRGGDLPVGEWNDLFDLAQSVGATPLLAFMDKSRGFEFRRLVAKKDGSKKRQPFEPWCLPGKDNALVKVEAAMEQAAA